ncbi:putative protein kinase RLK-Pelle-CrRLK1L-1 family [Rosa chinensis]|uniref:Protein kinase domain-containing protein n=3 Tax=Rosa chinensis TaxID=74649 RepID=A0A2P6S3T2_ROSCH|nr:putative protein kinase RLK-Pelle-CrRLK1L-1 family [Rosa chinensis]
MKPIFIPLNLSSLFLLIVTLLVAGESAPIYSPTYNITLNCGFSGDKVSAYDFQTWTGDINSKFFPEAVGGTSQVGNAPPSSSLGSYVPFTTARLSHSEFTYRFPVSPGQKFIRLYFFPATYNADFDSSKSLFSVKAGGYTLLKDFNASLGRIYYNSETLLTEFCLNFEPDQRSLNITFTPSQGGYAFINGIEIMSMPTNLYHSAAQGDGASYLGSSDSRYLVKNNTALQMIYRINVGGNPVSPNEDTGMYRTWDPPDEFFLDDRSKNLSISRRYNTHLNFARIFNYTAPEEVYRTGRTMGGNSTINKSYNLTWRFPVDPDFSYLVRLHFCEIDPNITAAKDRMFQIFIANFTAEPQADIIHWTTENGIGNGIPIYRDYFVPMLNLGTQKKGSVNISVALQAYQDDYLTRYNDAILNGLEIFKLNDTDGNLGGPIPELPNITPKVASESSRNSKKKSIPMLAILAGVVSVLLVVSVVGFLLFRRGRKVKDSNSSKATKWGPYSFSTTKSTKSRGSSLPSDLCRHFSLAEIKAATQNFNDVFIIGVGGFGNVYKGYVDDGSTPVAIKRLKPESSQGAREFKTEIEMLSQLRHLHLVSLVGYCTEQGEMILVYDYMARGTLRDHLYRTENPPLPWEQRLQICIGAARGLHYLHTGAKRMIIHRDVKSTNILLDEKWVAKVSDFGLSKMGTTTLSKTHISTVVKGSFGYLDPEYYRRQQLTEKSDVYSFGVVLCEVLCARPALIRTAEKKQMSLAEWTKTSHRNGTINQIIDPNLRGKIAATCLNKFVELALSCMNDNGSERPSMNDVVWGLEFALQLQQSAEAMLYSNVEKEGEDEVALMKGNDAGMSCSWEYSSDSKNSRTTKTSSDEQISTTNESMKGMSGTIFSEIKDPTVR